ncbi:hypothetical protein C4D60_Mb08t16730 [Musa balbisiana]|uniref:Uncharacterized protein n=1 Tax=Musa balbisiana TaxID=52838 RepID=A0A4S8K4A2_MUSBA|nr:hypothetical protein C4D60_Mb08t16730 [Musa balbisiana]
MGLQHGCSSSYIYIVAGGVGGSSMVELMMFVDIWDMKLGDWCCSCGVHNYASRSNHFKRHMIRAEDDVASMVA